VSRAGEDLGSGPGDLGRRARERRKALGLSREEVAARAGMVAGYLEYVETGVASLPVGALLRLAAALETTAGALGGGGIERPPGRARAGGRPVLKELTHEECLRLLAGGGVGRVVFVGEAGPAALPVNFALMDGEVVFRTAADGVVAGVIGSKGTELAFEVDHVDDALAEGWSVLIRGRAHPLTEEEQARVQGLGIEPWADGVRDLYIRLESSEVTGRRIRVG
jgi:transcriptional regulator with XRE-family HTH domain